MSTFSERVAAILDRHVGTGKYAVISKKDYPTHGTALVEVDLGAIQLKFVMEKGVDFWIEVASPLAPNEYYNARELLLLISGDPIERSRVLVGHDITALDEVLSSLVEVWGNVVTRLQPENLAGRLRICTGK